MTIQNGRISSTMLGYEDHGILTCWLQMDFSGTGQGFGGFDLDAPPLKRASGFDREPSVHAGFWIARILKTVGVEKWEDLKGKYVRVDRGEGWGGLIEGIGHITDDSLWFYPKKEIVKRWPELAEASR